MNGNKSIQRLLFGLFLIFLFACNSSTQRDQQVEITNEPINNFFDEAELGAFGGKVRLFLNARFMECGEWGGHEEKMVVYAKADKEFYLNYQKFKVDCNTISKTNGTPSQKLELEKTLKLNKGDKKSIGDYIQRMVKSKIEARFPGHAGNLFTVMKSDSTLLIEVYAYKKYDVDSYNKLLTELKLPATAVLEY